MPTLAEHIAANHEACDREQERRIERLLSDTARTLQEDLQAYLEFEKQCKAARIDIREQLYDRRQEIVRLFESLPIHTEGVRTSWTMYFVLACGEWWPATVGNEGSRFLKYRIDCLDGSAECGFAANLRWAHCTADNTVNFHWLEREEDDEIQRVRFEKRMSISKQPSLVARG